MMIKPSAKLLFNARNLFLGFFLFAFAFMIFFWQFVGLSSSPPLQNVPSAVDSFEFETVPAAPPTASITGAVAKVMQQTTKTTAEKFTSSSHQRSSCNNRTLFKVATADADDDHSSTAGRAFQWCSADSSARGAHQKVISYSLFGTTTTTTTTSTDAGNNKSENVSVSDRFVKLLRNISMTSEKSYPGWIVRIYHNFRNQSSVYNQLIDLSCQFNHVDLCSLTEMTARLLAVTSSPTTPSSSSSSIDPGLLRGLNGRMFRFLVMLDPDVDTFISRDIDSVIWQREVDSVDQWLKSNFTFHLMRDHKFHSATILAGMWGVKLHQRRDLVQGLTRAMILAGQNQHKSTDQDLLDKILWPSAQYDVMAHDSYHCRNGNLNKKSPIKVLPFPTRRTCSCYVGGIGEKLKPEKCPEACRPPDHKDWEYC